MYSILFVCHGNICRSPMAEYIMRDLLKKRGVEGVIVSSAATSTEELGNSVHRGTRAVLTHLGIDCSDKRARQITRSDYEEYDLIIGMDSANIRNMRRMLGRDPEGKIHKLLSFAGSDQDISDPWYTGDFDATWRDVLKGCEGLLKTLEQEGRLTR